MYEATSKFPAYVTLHEQARLLIAKKNWWPSLDTRNRHTFHGICPRFIVPVAQFSPRTRRAPPTKIKRPTRRSGVRAQHNRGMRTNDRTRNRPLVRSHRTQGSEQSPARVGSSSSGCGRCAVRLSSYQHFFVYKKK